MVRKEDPLKVDLKLKSLITVFGVVISSAGFAQTASVKKQCRSQAKEAAMELSKSTYSQCITLAKEDEATFLKQEYKNKVAKLKKHYQEKIKKLELAVAKKQSSSSESIVPVSDTTGSSPAISGAGLNGAGLNGASMSDTGAMGVGASDISANGSGVSSSDINPSGLNNADMNDKTMVITTKPVSGQKTVSTPKTAAAKTSSKEASITTTGSTAAPTTTSLQTAPTDTATNIEASSEGAVPSEQTPAVSPEVNTLPGSNNSPVSL